MTSVDIRRLMERGPLHFVGIGGAGMCALAEAVLRAGGQVTGCDMKANAATHGLETLGAEIHEGHDPAHGEGAAALVVTSAVPFDHPEITYAKERGIPVIKRAEALGSWVGVGRVLAIAGTHGKTTTCAMVTEVMIRAGADPTAFVGGRVPSWGGNHRPGGDDLFIVEADEFDRSFHALAPDVAVVTNLEADHLDIYGDLEGIRRAFVEFLGRVSEEGAVIACGDDSELGRLLPRLHTPSVTYGLGAGTRLRGLDVELGSEGSLLRVLEEGRDEGELRVGVPGMHNVLNALGAAGAARRLGAPWDAVREGLEGFRGVARRFECLGEERGVAVVDDYAHHPSEIRASLAAARVAFPRRRIVAVFQPHLYSRTRDFLGDFGDALSAADTVWVTEVFPAREDPIPGIDGRAVAEEVTASGRDDVRFHSDLGSLPGALADHLERGDVCLTLGAGSIEGIGPELLLHLQNGGEHA